MRRLPSSEIGCFLVLLLAVCLMYAGLPRNGDIYWSDASRHALNGAFVLDFLRALPFHHPTEFAYDYYRQWPALTILFYPPLFYFALAGTYAAFGVSEGSALLAELAFVLLLAWGAFRLSRHWLAPLPSLAVALIVIGAPELAYWGRQIMLDVPAYAFLVWAGGFLVRYSATRSRAALFAMVLCAVAAVYTKYNSAFFAVPIAVSVLYVHGRQAWRDRGLLAAAALGAVLLLPAAALFFGFAHYNLQQAASVPGMPDRWSLAGLTYYARVVPSVVSWPVAILACLYLLALPFAPRLRLPRADAWFLAAWVLSGYAFYSMIALKEPRDILLVTYPITLAAVLFCERTLPRAALRCAALLVLVGGVWAVTLATRPAPFVTGMREAAEAVAKLAPAETNVGFWGALDGTFIYAMRAYSGRPDLGVVRLDKLLFSNLGVTFERGFTENAMTPEQLTQLLFDLHVQYLVVQVGYRDDLAPIKMLDQAVAGDRFTEVARIPMTANYRFSFLGDLVIYRLKADVPRGRVAPQMQIRLLGRSL